ncbi:MAG: hypothetical protein U0V18_03910 [Anaerolineales bacterium]
MQKDRSYVGLILFTLAYPAAHYIVGFIPNPFVPEANLAINMIFPILAGYFYGPVSGAMAGLFGTGISAILTADVYDALAILPHTLMGLTAGFAGNYRQQFLAACSVLLGHALNILFFWRFGYLFIEKPPILVLGLLTETTVDVVAVILFIVFLHRKLYCEDDGRW